MATESSFIEARRMPRESVNDQARFDDRTHPAAVHRGQGMSTSQAFQQLLIRRATSDDYETLIELWRRSVTATHGFLTEADIELLLPDVRAGLLSADLELWVSCLKGAGIVGFMGLSGGRLEALFLDPLHLRAGIGRRMVTHAMALKGDLSVDVNEQNPAAVRFYEACGFVLEGRSPLDSAGRPFPILHMESRAGST
jgi:putative acetyltransferase